METKRICPSCKKPLAPDAPGGLCPDCLLQAGLGTGVKVGPGSGDPQQPRFVAPAPEEIAPKFPQLDLLSFIGQGGMGAVYKARQKGLDRIVALKILPPGVGADPAFAQRFEREAKAMARLNHPGIVTIHEFGRADGLFYFLMEFVDGVSLRQLLAAGRMAPREALAIVPQICDALQYAHDEGIVHRDIKPENILIDRRGRVKVADFGLAKLMGGVEASEEEGGLEGAPALTQAGKVMGTPHYMAPEQQAHPGEVDHRVDIYALGVVLYQMLTGELPGKPLEPPSRKVHVDVRLDEVVLRALEANPERRYAQASVFKTQVEALPPDVAGSENPKEPELGGPISVGSPWGSKFAPWAAGACAFAFVALAISAKSAPHRAAEILSWIGAAGFGFAAMAFGVIAFKNARSQARKGTAPAKSQGDLFWIVLSVAGWAFLMTLRQDFSPIWVRALMAALAAGLLVSAILLFVRRRLKQMSADPVTGGSRPGQSSRGWLALAVGLLILVAALLAGVSLMQDLAGDDLNALSRSPQKLRSASTETVIQAAIEDVKQPWPWQELENRVRNADMGQLETVELFKRLSDWIRKNYPEGYTEPLYWMSGLMKEVQSRKLLPQAEALSFVQAFLGNGGCAPLPRVFQGDLHLPMECRWRSVWDRELLGFSIMNEMSSITIDGQRVSLPTRDVRWYRWDSDGYDAELPLPALTPGDHVLRCEIKTALVAPEALAGLDQTAPSRDWPPAALTWLRTNEANSAVYPADAEPVQLDDNPADNPVAAGALGVRQVIIRNKGLKSAATVSFGLNSQKLRVPVGFKARLVVDGKSYDLGVLWSEVPIAGRSSSSGGTEFTVDIAPLPARAATADLTLTPDAQAVKRNPGISRIWGQEVEFRRLPLTRQDLANPSSDRNNRGATGVSTDGGSASVPQSPAEARAPVRFKSWAVVIPGGGLLLAVMAL